MKDSKTNMNCAIIEQVLCVNCIELGKVAAVFLIDEDDDYRVYGHLWRLDQRFAASCSNANALVVDPTVLTAIDNPKESKASWAIFDD